MVSAGLFAASNFDRESAMSLKMLSSCVAYPFTVSTRLGIRSLRRWIWFCTSPHAPLIASSCVVNLLYEHPDNVTAITASTNACSDLRINLSSRFADSPIPRFPDSPIPRFPDSPLPTTGGATAARTAAAKPAKATTAGSAASAEPTDRSAEAAAAESTGAAGPVAPRSRAPVAAPPPPAASRNDDQHQQPEDDRAPWQPGHRDRPARDARRGNVGDRDVALLADAVDDAGRPVEQSLAVGVPLERRRNRFADGLPGEPVGDDPFEVIADLDLDLAVVDRDQDEQAVVLALVADAAAPVLEHLDRVLFDAAVGLIGRHGGDDQRVTGRFAQRADAPVELVAARGVDHVGEVVDRLGQRRCRCLCLCLRKCRMPNVECQKNQYENECRKQLRFQRSAFGIWHLAFGIRH